MKKIIVPFDFSSISENAFAFANAFAESTKHSIKVVHIGQSDNFLVAQLPSYIDSLRNTQKRKLNQFVSKWKKEHETSQENLIAIEQEVIIGDPVNELVRMSKAEDCDFIIMGTTGSKNALSNFLGTTSTAVSQGAFCPVFLVPQGVSFSGFKHLLYAGNYESADKKMLTAIESLSNAFDSNIHLVHVNNPEKNKLNWEFEELILEKLFQKNTANKSLELHTVHHNTFWEGINEYVTKKEIDLIVMVTYHRKFWQRIVHQSTTKSMLLNTKIPLMVMHLEDPILTQERVQFT